jgi:hypothetical protein
MPTQLPTFTPAASKAAFVHVTDVILDNSNITAAIKENGIEDISSILNLTDVTVEHLTYHDSDPNVTPPHRFKMGEIGLIKIFIHFVHYCKEINNPIDDQWLTITQDAFDQFRANLKYTCRFASLSSLPPLAMSTSSPSPSNDAPIDMQKIVNKQEPSMPVKDELLIDQQNGSIANPPRALDDSNDHDVTDVHDVTNILDATNVQDVTNVVDVSYDLSSTSDISQVTTTGVVLMVHHYVNT